MPELPEIVHLAKQMDVELSNKELLSISNYQEKSLNLDIEHFNNSIKGQKIESVISKGKWLKICLKSKDYIAINLGMGGEIYLSMNHAKLNTKIVFKDDTYLAISFWWFGHIHFVKKDEKHTMDDLGLDLINEDVSSHTFVQYLSQSRGYIKNLLLNQKKIAGIGNYYIHDILFLAKIHPLRKANTISEIKLTALYQKIIEVLKDAISQGGSDYEQDIFAKKGHYSANLVAYKEGKNCPVCQSVIKKIKTSSTTSYICPTCQT